MANRIPQTIRIDPQVWLALQERAKPFVETPNDVLRRVLGLGDAAPTVPTGSATGTDGGRTGTKDLKQQFWMEFLKSWEPGNTRLRHSVEQDYDRRVKFWISRQQDCLLEVRINTVSHWIAVTVILTGPDAGPRYDSLLWGKETIRSEIGVEPNRGEELVWFYETKPETQRRWIQLRRNDMDVKDREKWGEQHQWLQKHLKIFCRVFASQLEGCEEPRTS